MGRKKKTTGTFDDWFSNYSQQNGIDISGANSSGSSYSQNYQQAAPRKKATFDDWFTGYAEDHNIDLTQTQQRQETPSYVRPTYKKINMLPTNQQAPGYTQNPLVQAAQNAVRNRSNGYITGSEEGDRQYQNNLQNLAQGYASELRRRNATDPFVTSTKKEIEDIQNQIVEIGQKGNVADLMRIQELGKQQAEKSKDLSQYRSALQGAYDFDPHRAYLESMDDNTLAAYQERVRRQGDIAQQNLAEASTGGVDWMARDQYMEEIDNTRRELGLVQRMLDSRNWNNRYQDYMNLRNQAGFDGSYQSTYNDIGERVDPRGSLNGAGDYIQTEMSKYGDITYDYLNNDPNAMQVMHTMNPYGFRTGDGAMNSYYAWLNDEEKQVFNHLYKQSPEQAYEFMDFMADELEKRERTKNEEYMSALADKDPVGMSMLSVSTALGAPIAAVSQLGSLAKDGEFDVNGWGNQFSYIPTTIRKKVSENIAEKSEVGSFLYNTGMSMADNFAQMAMTGGTSQAAVLLMMGTKVFADTVTEGVDQGKDSGEILLDAFVRSGIEVLTEKIGLDEVFDFIGGTRSIDQLLKSAAAEGGEEGLSDILNLVWDYSRQATTGKEADLTTKYNSYRLQGYSDKEAKGKVVQEFFGELSTDVLGGALSGFAMSGGGALVNDTANGFQYRELGKEIKASLPETSQYQRVGNRQLGEYFANMEQADAEETQTETEDIMRSAAEQLASPTESAEIEETSEKTTNESPEEENVLKPQTELRNQQIMAPLRMYSEAQMAEESERNYIDKIAQDRFGTTGYEVYRSALQNNGVQSINERMQTLGDFTKAYNAGMNNQAMPTNLRISEQSARAAYATGQNAVLDQYRDNNGKFKKGFTSYYGSEAGLAVDTDIVRKAVAEGLISQKDMDGFADLGVRLGTKIYLEETMPQNGWYEKGGIGVALDADNGMRHVLSHEFVHRLQEAAPEEYETLKSYIADYIGSEDLERSLSEYYNLGKSHGISISQTVAMDEVVADWVAGHMVSGDLEWTGFVERASQSQEGRTFLQKIRDFFRNIVNKLKGSKNPDVIQLSDAMVKAQKLLDDTLNAAQRNVARGSEATVSEAFKRVLESRGAYAGENSVAKYSLRSWNETDINALKSALQEAGYSTKEINKWIKDVNGVAATVLADRTRLDYEADEYQSALKPNAEYYYTLDLSTLCKKRLLYQGTYNAIMHQLVNKALMPEDTIKLRRMMDDMGYEVPCGICYEESRKKNEGKFAERWLHGHEKWAGYENQKHSDPYIPKLDDVTTTDGRAWLQKNHPEAYDSYIEYQKGRGSANPKVSFTHTDYRGDILRMTKTDISNVKHIGGLRIQSFSDFETVHVIDMMQAVMDMASKNLTAQAYTKVPAFADIFGGTGIKINLSLIGKVENGKLVFDAKEGIDPKEAFRIRRKYSENVGTILVGANDESILAAWADPRIDMVIPFHRSGWSGEEFEKLGLKDYSDYTDQQSERYLMDGRDISLDDASKILGYTGKNKLQGIYSEDYWDYSKSGKENAEAYLKLCAEKHYRPVFYKFLTDNGDGTWSLPADGSADGYWKSLTDYKMYNNEGIGAKQQEVKPNFDMRAANKAMREYDGNPNTLPVAQDVVDRFVKEYKAESKKFSLRESDSPVSQAISSAKTSIKQIPALFRNKNVEFGEINIDIGGGRFDLATDYLASIGTKNMVFDPYNRSDEVNSATLQYLMDGNRADTATCANVLNVIAEPAARANVILETAKAIKPDGKAYFMVYEGDQSGIGRETSSGWQNNLKTAGYVEEIGEYFNNVKRQGKLITASDPIADLPKASWETSPGNAVRYSLRDSSGFYSQLERQVEAFKGDKIGASSLIPYLKGKGVKDEEIKWTGLATFLEGKKSVSKEDVLQYVRDNQLEIREEVLTADLTTSIWSNGATQINADYFYDVLGNGRSTSFKNENEFREEAIRRAKRDGYNEEDVSFEIAPEYGYMLAETEDDVILEARQPEIYELRDGGFTKSGATRWESYTLSGGSNYREILFQLPSSDYTNAAMKAHWGSENRGVLVHARVQDFDTGNGKVLFVEEIQSDWHNAGQKSGYADESLSVENADLRLEGGMYKLYVNGEYAGLGATEAGVKVRGKDMVKLDLFRRYASLQADWLAPDAPFKNNYTDFALKSLLRMAAEGDYDYLSWTSGEIQEDRWSSEYAEGYRIEYDQDIPKFLKKYGKQWGANLTEIRIKEGDSQFDNEWPVQAIPVNAEMKESVLTEGQPRFSLRSDSEGRKLSKGQQEYFKDSKILDEDGNLRVVYHGSSEAFNTFDISKGRSGMDIQGSFFSPWEIDAAGYGENVRAYYLNITNPAPEQVGYQALRRFQGQNYAGTKAREYLESLGYDGVNNGDEEYIAFYPEQIKLVDNQNPTNDKDVRYSLRGSRDIVAASERDSRIRNEYMEAAASWRSNMTALSDVGKSGFSTNMTALIRDYNKSIDKNTSERIVGEIRNLTREMVRNQDLTYSEISQKANVIAAKILWGTSDSRKFPDGSLLFNEDAARAVDDIRNDVMAQILKSTTRGEGKYQALSKEFADYRKRANDKITEVRRKRDAKLEEIQAKKREEIARKVDSSERTTLLKRMNRLNKIMKTTSEANQEMIRDFIGEFNLVAKSMTAGKAENLADLSDYIDNMMRLDPDFMPTERTIKDVARLGKKNVADLTIEEVAQLNEALLNLENAIRTSKRLIDSEYKQHISELGNEIIEGVRNTKGIANSKIGVFNWFQQTYDKTLATPVIRPETEILRLVGFDRNNPLYKLTFGEEGSLASGQKEMVRYKWQANKRYTDRFVNDKQFADSIMGKEARACEITGKRADGTIVNLKVTPDMLMALYMHAQNKHNFRHFGEWNDESGHTQHGGGITIPDFDLYRKGKIQEAYRVGTRDGNLITMTRSALNAAFKQLTEKEMSFIRSAQAYYSEMSQPEINRVSNLLLGYSIANEENYFRINTDSNYRGTNMDAIKFDGTIEGMGWTKERIEGARNAILLIPLTEQFQRDIDAHAKYIGMAIPVRNFNKAYGVNRQSYDENGDFTGTETSVQSAITGKWGSGATDYIQKLMSDVQNPQTSSESWTKIFGKLRSFYAGSVLALNAGVAIKQAASYPTAAAEIGWGPLIKAFGNTRLQGKMDMDLINKYSPLMYLRTQGMGYQELADLKNLNKGWLNRALNSKALNWIQDMDVMTVKKLWKASEYYVRDNFKDLQVGSEEYYKKVGEVHSRVIERTQPNYTTLQRGEILRSDSDFIRMTLGMFKTQPFQNFSILFEATGELQAACRAYKVSPNEVTEAMRTAAVKKMARALSSQIVASLVFALMQAAWDWTRGRDDKYKDKEGRITFASAFKQIGINMGSNAFGMIPLGSVIYEAIETTVDTIAKNNGGEAIFNATAYGLDASTATGIVNDLVDAVQSLTKISTSVDLESKNTTEQHVRGVIDILSSAVQAAGYPADNFVKDGQAVAVNVFRLLGATGQMSKYEQEFYSKRIFTAVSKDKKGYLEILYNAYDNDTDAYNKLYSIYTENDGFATSSKTSKEYIDDKMNAHIKEQTKNQNRDKAGLTESQLNDYQEALDRFDTDHNNKFTQEETYNALMSIALSQKQKETLWDENGWKKSFSEYKPKK